MKKIFFILLFVFSIGLLVKAQEQEDMIVFHDDLDSCNIVRPDVMPKDFQLLPTIPLNALFPFLFIHLEVFSIFADRKLSIRWHYRLI